jgi:hypothetical protein
MERFVDVFGVCEGVLERFVDVFGVCEGVLERFVDVFGVCVKGLLHNMSSRIRSL